MIRISGWMAVAIANESRACIPSEYALNGWSRNRPSSVNSAISSVCLFDLVRGQPEIAERGADVLAAGELRVKPAADLEQRLDVAVDVHAALGRRRGCP